MDGLREPRDWGYAVLGLWLVGVGSAWTAWLGLSMWMVLSGAVVALGLLGLVAAWQPADEPPPTPTERWLGLIPVYNRRDVVIGVLQLVFGVSAWLTASTLEGWPATVAVVVGLGIQVLGVGALLAGVQPKDSE